MIIHYQICNFCNQQIEIPEKCDEDSFFNKNNNLNSEIFGLSLDINVSTIKSLENYKRRMVKPHSFTFCGKECAIEYLKKAISENGLETIL